ncbi:sialidase family protein [Chitinophaga japonensis]|uniref:exo-alpha-sialidase n=1 Tax=Chitinophaga japonensis TaxID=104662 RepID=A0A562T4Y0_CHIJA|nr:sialidase family protein [Chitinophaga japonensis]TWI88589.1 sialidase-1 [Chitinophaga japonensis]
MTSLKNLLMLVLPVLWLSCKGSDNPPAPNPAPEPGPGPGTGVTTLSYIYAEGTYGYEVYRIPALVRTKKGTLLAFAEARKKKSNGDAGDIDLVVKRSENNGQTWSYMTVVWDDGANTCGNPVPIVDEETGQIHLLMSWNHGEDTWGTLTNGTGKDTRRAYYTSSSDDGKTWAVPREITSSVKKAHWDWYATGPVHGIQLKNGPKKGRLIAPCYYTFRLNGARKDYSQVIYSDDHGRTWIKGDTTSADQVGECTVEELKEGRIMLNLRTSAGTARRFAVSHDGGETLDAVKTDYTLVDPHCQGSLLSIMAGQHTLFFANAASMERKDMTVKMSADEGKNWLKQYRVWSGPSAYSDMTQLSDTTIALLFEGGQGRPYEGIAFEVIPLSKFR